MPQAGRRTALLPSLARTGRHESRPVFEDLACGGWLAELVSRSHVRGSGRFRANAMRAAGHARPIATPAKTVMNPAVALPPFFHGTLSPGAVTVPLFLLPMYTGAR